MINISKEERTALERFRETSIDEGSYDVPKRMMKRLAEIGLLQHLSRGIYRTTDFRLFVLDDKENEIMKKQLDGLHNQIMNIRAEFNPHLRPEEWLAYREGHRDARHAAAELVAEIEAGKEEE